MSGTNDGEWLLARSRAAIESTYFAGDAYPCVFPYFGTGGHAKYVAPESSVEYAPSTIWVHPCVDDLASFDFSFDPDTNKVFRRELEVIEYLVSECRGDYLVGATDNCGSYDALAQLYGNERLLCDFIDDPEPVKAAAAKLVDILKRSSERFFAATKRAWQDGAAHGWMNTYSRGNHLQLQCDLSVMISPEIYDEFIRSELVSTARFLEHAVYHFDGIEQIRQPRRAAVDTRNQHDSVDAGRGSAAGHRVHTGAEAHTGCRKGACVDRRQRAAEAALREPVGARRHIHNRRVESRRSRRYRRLCHKDR